MEDVLEVSAEPYDPTRPKVNFDETRQPRLHETRPRLPAQPGKPQRLDDDYERNGTPPLFFGGAPQSGARHGQVTEQRPAGDFAHERPWLVDLCAPAAEVIRVGLDHLNTHTSASL